MKDMPSGYALIRIPKKDGGIRILHVPNPALRAEQDKILKILKRFNLSFGPWVHGYARRRSIRTNAEALIVNKTPGQYYVPGIMLKLDVRDYFHNVTDKMVEHCLRREKCPPWIIDEVKAKCFVFFKGKMVLPQGAPTSPFLSALVMKYISIRLSGLLKQANPWCPSRMAIYADNITFVSDDPVIYSWARQTSFILKKLGFEINPSKVHIHRRPGRMIVCGVQVNDKVGPPRAVWRNLRAEMHNAWMDRKSGMVPAGFQLSHATRRLVRMNSFIFGHRGVVKKADLDQRSREALKGKTLEPLPFERWRGQIEFVKSLDPDKGKSLEAIFRKVEAICRSRVGPLSTATAAP